MKKVLLAGGICMIVIAIIVFGPSSWINKVESSNIQKCNSFIGQLSQTLNPEHNAICNMAPVLLAAGETTKVVAIILALLGIALTIVGIVHKGSPKTIKDEIN